MLLVQVYITTPNLAVHHRYICMSSNNDPEWFSAVGFSFPRLLPMVTSVQYHKDRKESCLGDKYDLSPDC